MENAEVSSRGLCVQKFCAVKQLALPGAVLVNSVLEPLIPAGGAIFLTPALILVKVPVHFYVTTFIVKNRFNLICHPEIILFININLHYNAIVHLTLEEHKVLALISE